MKYNTISGSQIFYLEMAYFMGYGAVPVPQILSLELT